jgi:uncharacterized protein (DUF2249 family)
MNQLKGKQEMETVYSMPVTEPHLFDARGIARRFRHAAFFGALGMLESGETMRFHNDHDPLPLLAKVSSLFGLQVVVEYVSKQAGDVVIDFHII